MKYAITKGRLNKMLKYFKGKNVCISYEYNNSMGMSHMREYKGIYTNFLITALPMRYGSYFKIELFEKTKAIFEQEFSDIAEFTGSGEIEENNSGPYNFFTIKLLN